jgi:lathosterol oxidase
MILMTLVAGGLHWFFHGRKVQGNKLKYDGRELSTKGRQFNFGNQVKDNAFWAMGNGWAPVLSFAANPVWFVLLFLLTPVSISLHFYWVHRALHWDPFYKLAHALHHRNVNVGPWSGLSMHPVEHVMFFSSILIHFIIPAHPLHILFHMHHQSLTAATSHPGFENLLVRDKK